MQEGNKYCEKCDHECSGTMCRYYPFCTCDCHNFGKLKKEWANKVEEGLTGINPSAPHWE